MDARKLKDELKEVIEKDRLLKKILRHLGDEYG